MKIAIPLTDGKLSAHFGHCQSFALLSVDEGTKKLLGQENVIPPPHEPGRYPVWLAGLGASHIIAGGMGQSAQSLFARNNIQVVVGAPSEAPEKIAEMFLQGKLETGANACDH